MLHESQDIHAHQLGRMANIAQNISMPNQGTLEKGNVVDAFTYGENKLFINKTGTEIKVMLQATSDNNNTKLGELKAKADAYLAQCVNVAPIDDMYSDYQCGPTDVLPKVFTYKQIREYGKGVQQVVNSECDGPVVSEKTNDGENVLDMYNDTIRAWARLRKDNSAITTITNGLVDKTTYKLSVAQANAIGF